MNLITITQRHNGNLVAVVENPNAMSRAAVATAWAKAMGYEQLPSDLVAQSADMTKYSVIEAALRPIEPSS